MSYRQFDLRHDDHRMTCWLKEEPTLKRGSMVKLKGDNVGRYWEVVRVSESARETPLDPARQIEGTL